jgi:hypothetical protein
LFGPPGDGDRLIRMSAEARWAPESHETNVGLIQFESLPDASGHNIPTKSNMFTCRSGGIPKFKIFFSKQNEPIGQ